MNTNPVGWFELPATDIERAQKFYEALLNVTLERRDIPEYETAWFPYNGDGYGAAGAIFKGMGYVPTRGGSVVYFSCEDIDAAIERGVAAGATLFLPKKDIGKNGFIAWLEDTEGNTIGLHMWKKE